MARGRRRGLPAPRIVGREKRRRRNSSPLVLSLIVHLLFGVLITFYLATVRIPEKQAEEAIDVLFIDEPKNRPIRTKPLPRFVRRAEGSAPSPDWETISSRVPQVVVQSNEPLLTAANPDLMPLTATLPTLETAADVPERARSALVAMRSTNTRPTPGKGTPSGIQRPKGRGGGRNLIESSGTAAVGMPGGNGRGEGKGQGDGGRGFGNPFDDVLARIGESIAQGTVTGKADVLFLLDTSGSMRDNISAVADSLFHMTDALDAQEIDYRLSVVEFRELGTGVKVDMSGWSPSAEMLRKRMYALGVVGNERALDAFIQVLDLTRFRPDADPHIVFVTDEPVSTRWETKNAVQELEARILEETAKDRIRVQVLGFPERFQRDLAAQTGGTFETIPSTRETTNRKPSRGSESVLLRKTALDGTFRDIAGRIIRWVKPDPSTTRPIDVVLFIDFSRTMQGRLRAVNFGISALAKTLEVGGLNPTFVVVRFAKTSGVTGTGFQGLDISPYLTKVDAVQALLQYPTSGDDRLVDALVDGLRGLRLRRGVPGIGIVVTDEPPLRDKRTVDEMVTAMRESGLQFYIIGPRPPAGTGKLPALGALFAEARRSGGHIFAMPAAHFKPVPGR